MKRQRMMLAATAVVALLFLLTVGAPHASADAFNLTSCHLSGGCGTATNFGTVTLTDNGSGGVQFDVVLASGDFFVETGAGGHNWFDFNDNVAGSAVNNISATVNGTTVSVLGGLTGATNSSFMADGTGVFSAGVMCVTASSCNGAAGTSLTTPPGGTAQVNDLHFTVTNATVAALETLSQDPNGGQMFVADLYVGQTGGPAGCSGGTGGGACTGPVHSSPSVPDGGMTLMLLGGALFGLETLRRKIRA